MSPEEEKMLALGLEAVMRPVDDAFKNITDPSTKTLGKVLNGILCRQLRAFARVYNRASEMAGKVGLSLDPIPLKVIKPILDGASLEEDEEMQELWAALLANASIQQNSNLGLPPAFPKILQQLRSVDAQFLDVLYKAAGVWQGASQDNLSKHLFQINLGDKRALAGLYDEMRGDKLRGMRPDRLDDFFETIAELDNFSVTRSTLEMLGLLQRSSEVNDVNFSGGTTTDEQYFLTPLGCRFYLACQPPAKQA
jgi:hypothetical protein